MQKLIDIPDDWYKQLSPLIESKYFKDLSNFLREKRQTTKVYPEGPNVLRAFKETPLSEVRACIIGMD